MTAAAQPDRADRAPVVLHRAPLVLPVGAAPIRRGAVEVRGDRISWVGPARDYPGTAGDERDWPGILMPGLVNAHVHLQYSECGQLAASALPFPQWLTEVMQVRATHTEEQWRQGVRAGVAELLGTGTTCVADVVSDPCALEPLLAAGLAGVGYVEVIADAAAWEARRRDRLHASLNTSLDTGPDACLDTDTDTDTGAGAGAGAGARPVAGSRRAMRIGISPHSPYAVDRPVIAECVRLARARGLRLHPHLGETTAEVEFVRAGTGPFEAQARRLGQHFELVREGGSGLGPAGYLDALGALGDDVHVAHGTNLDAADRALLRERGTAVALCARSNRILFAGEPPVAAYRAEGSPVAVGTDGRSSAPSLDLLGELVALRDLALRQGSPDAGLDRWLVEAATLGGARALGLAGEVGILRPGARADLAVVDVPTAAAGGAGADPYAVLVREGAGRCVGTVLGGRVVHEAVAAQ